MKPQDLAVALCLACPTPPGTYAAIAAQVGLSVSEAHAAVRRLRIAGLVDGERTVRRALLLDFLIHGLRVVFPAVPAALSLGVPTGAAVFPGEEDLPEPEPRGVPWVWPSASGSVRGLAVAPLYPALPDAVLANPWLYRTLASLDLLRAGRARDVRWARTEIARRLGEPGVPSARSLDLSAPDALIAVFSRSRLSVTIARWLRERAHPLVEHPLVRPILAEYSEELAQHLSAAVPRGDHRPSPAIHVVGEKGSGGARDWSFPSFIDGLVARRLIDELEPHLRGADRRTFLARARTSSALEPGDYDLGAEWRGFVGSLPEAAGGMALALKTDIQEFFASIDHTLGRQIVAQRSGAHPRVIQLLFSLLRAWLPPGRLADRGLPVEPHDVSRLVAHAVLRTVDDEFEDGFDLRYRRYMDDTIVFCEQEDDLPGVRERYRRALASLGLSANEPKTETREPVALVDEYRESVRELPPPDQVPQLWRQFHVREPRTAGEVSRQRWLHRAARRVRVSTEMVEDTLEQLKSPALRTSALAMLERQSLHGRAVLELRALAEGCSAERQLQVVGTLARAPLTVGAAEGLVDWCWDTLDLCEGPVRSLLLLVVFKHGRRTDGQRLAEWATDPGLTDPLVRSTAEYLLQGWGIVEPSLPRWGPSDPDSVWAQRLLADVRGNGLRHPDRLLRALEAGADGAPTVRPEHLPLIHLLSRPEAPWAERLREDLASRARDTRDDAVRAHLRRALAGLS